MAEVLFLIRKTWNLQWEWVSIENETEKRQGSLHKAIPHWAHSYMVSFARLLEVFLPSFLDCTQCLFLAFPSRLMMMFSRFGKFLNFCIEVGQNWSNFIESIVAISSPWFNWWIIEMKKSAKHKLKMKVLKLKEWKVMHQWNNMGIGWPPTYDTDEENS